MAEKPKLFVVSALVTLAFLALQAPPSQASDKMWISVIQPDGVKTARMVSLGQSLSKLREDLVDRNANILPGDKFLVPDLGELSPRDEAGVKVSEALDGKVLSFKPRGPAFREEHDKPDPLYTLVERVYGNSAPYSPGMFQQYKDGATFSTQPHAPQKQRIQCALSYKDVPIRENVVRRGVPGKDGRQRILDTSAWPHSIHAHLGMKLEKLDSDTYMGSGVIVGPHHLLTCAHNVYEFDKRKFFEEIWVYPALNDTAAPFNRVKATKAYLFKAFQDRGDDQFDMALLLLDLSIGNYTGWGGLLSVADGDLAQEAVSVTGYPSDKGSGKEMWSMSHRIKTVKPEMFDYEIDTGAGQSGSSVWINKWGMPVVLGVHTLGSNDFNSGVRLSAKKFEKIVQIIKDTYILEGDVDDLDWGKRLILAPKAAPKPAISITLVAQGYEAIYQRFLNGALIYTDPKTKSKITLPIRDLSNPLEGTFDLSRCGDRGKYLSIATGYRKEKNPANANKVEIWFAPRFLIEKELNGAAAHLKPIMGNWKQEAPVGMFWTWGGWDDKGWYDYLTNENMDNLSKIDLYENYKKSTAREVAGYVYGMPDAAGRFFMFRL